jgi:repressor LexA
MKFKAVETARSHLEALVAEGRLTKRETASRSYALPPEVWASARGHCIPVLGAVQAGSLTLAVEEPEGFLEVGRARLGEELFALRVRGLSMSGAGILPDDLVIARRQASAQEGDIVVALVGEEATVKRLRVSGNKVVLSPENPDFEPIVLPPDKVVVLGKVIEVRRYYEIMPLMGMK